MLYGLNMIVICPSCDARYLVDPLSLGSEGRKVRCAKCNFTWHKNPPPELPNKSETETDLVPSSQNPIPLSPGANLPVIVSQRERSKIFVWAVIVLSFMIVVGGILAGRHPIVDSWPEANKFYSAIGMGISFAGPSTLSFKNVSRLQITQEGIPVLEVRGEVWSNKKTEIRIPPIRVAVIDSGGRELHHWIVIATSRVVDASKGIEFMTRLSNPPSAAASLVLTFVDKKDS
tara:strand:- start:28819 stop:29511 length:693 start_codon:yes stop_codon:yes gene_type:complete